MKVHVDPVGPPAFLEMQQTKNGYDAEIHPGWGLVTLCRNGVEFRRDDAGERTLRWYAQEIRRASMPHEVTPVWTLHIDAPFISSVYAFTPDGRWTLIDTKPGFM